MLKLNNIHSSNFPNDRESVMSINKQLMKVNFKNINMRVVVIPVQLVECIYTC